MEKKFLIVDADIIAYRFAVKYEQHIDWEGDGGDIKPLLDFESACSEADAFISSLKDTTKCSDVILCLSSDRNFRYLIYPEYKHNRVNKKEPALRGDLKNYLISNYDCRMVNWLEGDDCIGILAYSPRKDMEYNESIVMASIDKDIKQIPGILYNWDKDEYSFSTKGDGDYIHLYQTLVGDTCDGYPGCPGIGPKKATKFLSPFFEEDKSGHKVQVVPTQELWPEIVSLFESKGSTGESALTQAQVSRICRASDFNFTTKKPIYWRPGVVI